MPQTAIDDPTLALLSTWLWPLCKLWGAVTDRVACYGG